ncbi:MAG: thioredoxin-dependent thiol peroxidase [Candidatus Marinimicrobia bacterium]|nr:thioredoxin-dependent thiol peroxidase [Candidatus Neomarinimicrobiota bacterium]
MKLKEGKKAPEFCLNDKDGNSVCLKDYKNKWVILYFYPKDNTPGCTKEAIEFTEEINFFKKNGAEVIGISSDSEKSHTKFMNKHDLKVTLLSDIEKDVLKLYGVWQLKKMFGKEYHGVVRSTFLINPDGIIDKIWEKVKVNGHVEDVVCSLKDNI